ncbi:hypothetical protein COT99_01010 [Candidatus Falkowbacteria bacterium CG10_big_fil_rev_8_21_14_0_10_43_10]|uniref:Type II toxin-antitoxin system HicA family toxin n=1 Tax=Candidatus Falkowbacteria bacterium CG10_big_fil_rev_8_21_14_0_10_43_10 TaxID=1974567 RepID=A0A2H0V2V0_9BACT|nr:MAG: hypothetical protein COT99_01010 [Candidatus Falkowbacteria bacterium CG10_big_fil_rev_8_21_14_0_10_43_10]
MPKLPVISGKDAIKKLEKVGYCIIRQKGSHVRLGCNDKMRKLITIPMHNELKVGLLHEIIKDANLTVGEFINL